MESVLLSIQPKWCELIASGKKTIEVRKTRPKLQTPFKCCIYCTQDKHYELSIDCLHRVSRSLLNFREKQRIEPASEYGYYALNGKVIGEFVCEHIDEFTVFKNGSVQYWNAHNLEKSCLTYEQIAEYIGTGKKGYGWHISDLKIYDKPKALSEFKRPHNRANCGVKDCGLYDGGRCEYYGNCDKLIIKKAPQSWCFAEAV